MANRQQALVIGLKNKAQIIPWFGSNHLRLMVECCLVVDPKVGRASPPIVTPGLIQVPPRGRANVAYCEPTLDGRFDALRGRNVAPPLSPCHSVSHVRVQMKNQQKPSKIRKLIPGYMTMGQDGMAYMAEMGMPVPKNSLPMVGGRGQYDYITMGGLYGQRLGLSRRA